MVQPHSTDNIIHIILNSNFHLVEYHPTINMQPTLAFIAAIFGASVMADSICNPGELALGVNQLCTTEDP